jgi:hypothetical protein
MGRVDDGVQQAVNLWRKLGGSIPSRPTMPRASRVEVTAVSPGTVSPESGWHSFFDPPLRSRTCRRNDYDGRI